MPDSQDFKPLAADLEQAFAALAGYTVGSDRAALVPIDNAVGGCLARPKPADGRTADSADPEASLRSALEQRLLAILSTTSPAEAQCYACDKLRLIGTAASVPALSTRLADPAVGHAARSALDTLDCTEAGSALRTAAQRLTGMAQVGVILALGRRPDRETARVLQNLLATEEESVARAASAALGQLGTPEAAQILLEKAEGARAGLRADLGHACLDCASKLARGGKARVAAALYRKLTGPDWPAPIASAAQSGLDQVTG